LTDPDRRPPPQAIGRGDNLDTLVGQTDGLRDQANKFKEQGTQLRKRMW
jgi:hypothetical protein